MYLNKRALNILSIIFLISFIGIYFQNCASGMNLSTTHSDAGISQLSTIGFNINGPKQLPGYALKLSGEMVDSVDDSIMNGYFQKVTAQACFTLKTSSDPNNPKTGCQVYETQSTCQAPSEMLQNGMIQDVVNQSNDFNDKFIAFIQAYGYKYDAVSGLYKTSVNGVDYTVSSLRVSDISVSEPCNNPNHEFLLNVYSYPLADVSDLSQKVKVQAGYFDASKPLYACDVHYGAQWYHCPPYELAEKTNQINCYIDGAKVEGPCNELDISHLLLGPHDIRFEAFDRDGNSHERVILFEIVPPKVFTYNIHQYPTEIITNKYNAIQLTYGYQELLLDQHDAYACMLDIDGWVSCDKKFFEQEPNARIQCGLNGDMRYDNECESFDLGFITYGSYSFTGVITNYKNGEEIRFERSFHYLPEIMCRHSGGFNESFESENDLRNKYSNSGTGVLLNSKPFISNDLEKLIIDPYIKCFNRYGDKVNRSEYNSLAYMMYNVQLDLF